MSSKLRSCLHAFGDRPYVKDGRAIVVGILALFASAMLVAIILSLTRAFVSSNLG